MSLRFLQIAAVVVAAELLAGCMLVEQTQEFTRQSLRVFKPRPTDWDDTQDPSDEWKWVGDETRPHYDRERDPDRWFKKYVMSEKANAIEHNLGVD